MLAGLPDTIGKLENLEDLDLSFCESLTGGRFQLSFVVPMLHHLLIHRSIPILVDRDTLKAQLQLPKCNIIF